MSMYEQLCAYVVALADAFNRGRVREKLKPLADQTISKRIAGKDNQFIANCRDPGQRSFTAMTFDEVVDGFAANWPEKAKWPRGVRRPQD